MASPTESPSLASKLRTQMLKKQSTYRTVPGAPNVIKDNEKNEKESLPYPDSENECLMLGEKSTQHPVNLQEKISPYNRDSDKKGSQKGLKRRTSSTIRESETDKRDSEPSDSRKVKKMMMTELNLSNEETTNNAPSIPEQESWRMSLVRSLSEEAKSDNPPTPARVKVLGVQYLTTLLRFNDRPVYPGMGLDQLAQMVTDYMKNGCPPVCPKCSKGKLRFSNGKKRYGKRYYWCPGSMTHKNAFYGCNFKADRQQVTRVPWKCP